MKPTVRLRNPGDLVATVPYQLGYRPEQSLVVVALRAGRIGPIARLDLPDHDPLPDRGPRARADRADRADRAARAARQDAVQAVVEVLDEHSDTLAVICFESVGGTSTAMRDWLWAAADQRQLPVSTCVVVRSGHWWEIDPVTRDSRSTEPLPIPADHEVPAIAEFVALGVNPLASRHALTRSVAEHPDWVLAVVGQPVAVSQDPLRLWSRWFAGQVGDAIPGPRESARIARLLVILRDRDVRDALIAGLCPGALPLGDLSPAMARAVAGRLRPALEGLTPPEVHARLVRVLRSAPAGAIAPIAAVTACHMWWTGNGALARICLERALVDEPGYRLAGLLEAMLDAGIAPGRAHDQHDGPAPAASGDRSARGRRSI